MQKKYFKSFVSLLVICGFLLTTIKFSYAEAEVLVIDNRCYDRILSSLMICRDDVTSYKKIFQAIEKEDIRTADKLINKINNDVLIGHVLAEKYLSKSHNTKINELKTWLEKYNDYPQAIKIYNLAVRKGGKNNLNLPAVMNKTRPKGNVYKWDNPKYYELSLANQRFLKQKIADFKKAINSAKTLQARNILENANFRKYILNKDYDAFAANLSMVYFLDNDDAMAIKWGTKGADRSKDATGSWVAGLAFYRQHNYKRAAKYFSKLGSLDDNDEWLVSAGAYWASRSYEKLKNKKEAQVWMKIASKHKRTFYGFLANHKLGVPLDFNWTAFSYLNDFSQENYIDEIMSSPAIRRAVILIHAKQPDLAELELKAEYDNMNDKQKEIALFIANQYKMHSLGISMSKKLQSTEKDLFYDAVAYPVPYWKPKNGWKIDRALVLALARQESAFAPNAESSAGAKGLMQLLPNTAFHITKDASLKNKNNKTLWQAEYNLELGQKYVNYLMDKPFINGNLFFMMTAYNGGPGNLRKWQKRMKYDNDPLMFIETIPSRETRIYIERVMTNYWIYNSRMGKDSPSLNALVKGDWPEI